MNTLTKVIIDAATFVDKNEGPASERSYSKCNGSHIHRASFHPGGWRHREPYTDSDMSTTEPICVAPIAPETWRDAEDLALDSDLSPNAV